MATKYDLIVIGSGPAGRRAAIQAAKLGKSVLIVEKGRRVGGVSVHTGTIPSKTLRETVLNLSGWRERGFYGQNYKVKANICANDLKQRLLATLDHEVEVLEHQFSRNRVDQLQGTARFLSQHKIEITEENGAKNLFSFEKILISVGTRPFRPETIPFDGTHILDSDDVLDLQELPKSIVVIGAGVIGVEYATIFSALDIRVSLVEPREEVLDFVDREIIADFLHDLRDRGVQLRLGAKAESIERAGRGCLTKLEDGRIIQSDAVLFAAGRLGATAELNLSACNLTTDHRGRLTVNRQTFETETPSIYAAGDVIGFPSLASTSMEQGRIACCHAFGVQVEDAQEHFPYGIYSVPEISMVGMTEEEVREKGIPYECGVARFRETSRGHILGIDKGMMKMLFSLEDRRLLGVHIIGEGATELIHIGQAVITLGGTVEYFVNSIFNYPTLAEAYKIAALDAWNRMKYFDASTQPESETDVESIGQKVA